MAKIYKANGEVLDIEPKNGTDFQLEELQAIVGGLIDCQMAIMSHLSDAIEVLNRDQADWHINFAKQLVLTYPDTSVEVSENELNELWKKTIQ